MTAIAFSKFALKEMDKDPLENVILREEKNLKIMHAEFFGAITLFRLQRKLIRTLKHLLDLLSKPHTTLQALMRQISRISALYLEIHGELAKAKRHKDGVSDEIQAQANKLQELVQLANANYESKQERMKLYRIEQVQLSAHVFAPKQQLKTVSLNVKAILENLYYLLVLADRVQLALQRHVDNYCKKIIMERVNKRMMHSLRLHLHKLKTPVPLRHGLGLKLGPKFRLHQ